MPRVLFIADAFLLLASLLMALFAVWLLLQSRRLRKTSLEVLEECDLLRNRYHEVLAQLDEMMDEDG